MNDEFDTHVLKNTIKGLEDRVRLLENLLDTYFHLPLGISEVEYERHKAQYDEFLQLVRKTLMESK